ncbi:hypothetical protein KOI35_19935 [Actinoplanes bogorensis]|uniref:Uncharacterized protein n=1 Tax=Paractinoplanes bogorensis TaxID=1610840 RepID=A0ABS5YQR7_9ACTN|nr:hypothetical protein [Actinoplanes bogorensis]MBU2665784.1 hypothetical protein [Actinoplanes bogorensis]
MKTASVLNKAIPAVFAAWFVATVISQHPDRSYDKARGLDRTGTGILIPNWRFFAPNPAVEDQHFLYRLASEDKTRHSEWREVYQIVPRKMIHAFWFPGRRIEKAVFDAASTLVNNPGAMTPLHQKARESTYRLINDFVRGRLTPDPEFPLFQVMLVRYSGFDHSEDPKYDLVFDYERVRP